MSHSAIRLELEEEAVDQLLLASHLLQIVDAAVRQRRSQHATSVLGRRLIITSPFQTA